MHTYKIFLASSAELESERIAFGDKVQEINDRLVAQKKQVRFILYKWERDVDSFAVRRKQDEYNSHIENCDIFVMLYWTKVGKYSQEEYEFAYDRYLLLGKPFVLVYQKVTDAEIDDSIKEFQYLTFVEHEQFTPTFENAKALGIAFEHELQKLFATGDLSYGTAISLFGAPNEPPPTFIGRKKEIVNIQQFFDQENVGRKQLLIFSDGGVGKTTLAANYWFQNQYKYTYCAWLFCESGIVNGMEAIATAGMKNFAELASEYKETAIVTFLNSFTNTGKCLLVLDNVNEEQHLIEWQEKYGGLQWDVLITSRLNNLMPDEIPVKPMGIEDAVELFYSYYKRESRDQTEQLVLQLVKRLNCNTLLVELFAKNLSFAARGGETLESFYKKFESKGIGFIDDNAPVDTRYTASLHKQAATVSDVINILYDMTVLEPESRNLLQLIALLPAGNYNDNLLFELFEPQSPKAFLIKLSRLNAWMQFGDDSTQLSPLVQDMVLYKCDGQLPDGYEVLVVKLSELIDDDIKPIEEIIKTYQPIADGVLAACTKITSCYSNTLYNLIVDLQHLKKNVLHLQSDIAVSYRQLKQFIQREEGGEGHQSALIEAYMLFVDCCFKLDLFEEALYYQQIIIQIKKVGVIDGKGVTTALEKAGDICFGWQQYELSANYYKEAYENYPQQYPTGSLKEALWKNRFGGLLSKFGGVPNMKIAADMLREAEKTILMAEGENSSDVSIIRSNLALILMDLGGKSNLNEAKGLLSQVLLIGVKIYGENNPKVAGRRSNLAWVLINLGGENNLLDAEIQLREGLKSDIESYGEADYNVAHMRANLAWALRQLGGTNNLTEAENLLKEAVKSDGNCYKEESSDQKTECTFNWYWRSCN